MAVAVGKRSPAAPKEQQEMMRLRELLRDQLQSNSTSVTGLIRSRAASTEDEMFKAELLLVRLVCLEVQRYFYEFVYAMLVLVSNVNSLSFSAHNSSTEILSGIISAFSVEALTGKAKQPPTDTMLPVDADIFPAKKSGNGSMFECETRETVGGAQYDDDDDEDGGDDEEEAGDEGGDVEEEGVEDVHGGGDEVEEDEDAAEDQGEGDGADDDDDDDDPDEPYEEEEDEDDEDDEEDNDEEEEPPKKRKK